MMPPLRVRVPAAEKGLEPETSVSNSPSGVLLKLGVVVVVVVPVVVVPVVVVPVVVVPVVVVPVVLVVVPLSRDPGVPFPSEE
jgi:hypothetical protein